VGHVCCDNTGESYSVQTLCMKDNLGIQFEFTPPGTPQFNGRVERRCTTLYSCARAIFNGAGIPQSLKRSVWPQAALRATALEFSVCRRRN
jgi:hypothetical protein